MDKVKPISESQGGPKSMPQARKRGNLIVFTGPSGVGKGTICRELLQEVSGLRKSVSVTTRKQRPGEQEGVSYFFRSEDEFQEMLRENKLMEWAEFAGSHYGTPKAWVLEQLGLGLDVLLEIEVWGAKQIMQRFPEAVLIFIAPPSFEALRGRLVGRKTETPEKIAMRLAKAQQEMREKTLFHYEVVNDSVEDAVMDLAHIVYAERCRIRNSAPDLKE
jgi:guanylate kinase